MENIQSLNAAYATSGPMYLSDNEVAMADYVPKSGGTMTTMGRQRVTYGSRATNSAVVAASTPNISTSVPGNAALSAGILAGDALAFGDHHMSSTVPHSLRQARDNTILDLQTQLKEVFFFPSMFAYILGFQTFDKRLTRHIHSISVIFVKPCFLRFCVRMRCCGERWKLRRASSALP